MSEPQPVQDLEAALTASNFDKEKVAKAKSVMKDGESLAKALLQTRLASVEELCQSLTKFYGNQYVAVSPSVGDIFHLVPSYYVLKYKCLPIVLNAKILTLGMVDPKDGKAVSEVRAATGYIVNPVGILEVQFQEFLKNNASRISLTDVKKDGTTKSKPVAAAPALPENRAPVLADTGPARTGNIQRLILDIISKAVKQRVSDIHLEPQETFLLIRYRIDGFLRTVQTMPLEQHAQIVSAIKVMASLDITETRHPQDGRISVKLDTQTIDLRIATIMTNYGENVVIRVLDRRNIMMTLDQLGMSNYVQARLKEIGSQNTGMFLVTGPTGSGKTTTLYTFIHMIRNPAIKIITLEDPIEYPILVGETGEGGVTQIQIDQKKGISFSAALRAALRLDPDVILVGEIRDLETAEIAFSAALTGRLVLSTLHTNDAPSTIMRLLDMKVDPFLIAGALKAVMSQRLLRKLCSHCRVKYTPPPKALNRLAKSLPKETVMSIVPTLYRPRGCPVCGNRGYLGRVGLYELLEMNDDLRNAILSRASLTDVRKVGEAMGMKTLRAAGLESVLRGETTIAEIFRVTPQE